MGIRESLNEYKGTTIGVAIGIILLTIAVGVRFVGFDSAATGGTVPTAFFTVDDGKTFFADDGSRLPPFDYKGKTAYGCYVFTNDGGKTRYVGWLYRYTDQGKKHFTSLPASRGAEPGPTPFQYMEVKKPGTGEQGWIRAGDPRAAEVRAPAALGGATPEAVYPE